MIDKYIIRIDPDSLKESLDDDTIKELADISDETIQQAIDITLDSHGGDEFYSALWRMYTDIAYQAISLSRRQQ